MPILVTGGAGFIGSRLAAALSAHGESVVLLDNFDANYDVRLKRANALALLKNPAVTLIEGDVRDAALVEQIIADHGIDRVAHMAALTNVRASIENGPQYMAVNVTGSANLLDAARKHGVKLFVQASTSSVYGESTPIPFREDAAADQPLAPYPASKRAAEMLGHAYYHLFGMPVTCLRFFNVYGPNGRPDMMPLKVLRAVRDEQPITLYNGGKLSRDWTYIDDIIAGIISALDRPLGYAVINLGCGAPAAMTDFVDIVEELVGKTAIRVDAPAPLSETPITYCDNSRARSLLDFAPRTALADGLSNTWKWARTFDQAQAG